MKTKKPKKRNPQDATLTNIRALKKRVAELENNIAIKFEVVVRDLEMLARGLTLLSKHEEFRKK